MSDRITPREGKTLTGVQVFTRFETPLAPCEWAIKQEKAVASLPPDYRDFLPRHETPSQLRDAFLNISRGDKERLLDFLKRTGEWTQGKRDRQTTVALSSFWADQAMVRKLLLKKPRSRRAIDRLQERLTDALADHWRPAGLEVGMDDNAPSVWIVVYYTRALIFLSTWLDLVARSEFLYCARSDCPTHSLGAAPFKLTSKHHKIYCSTKCAKLEMVRKFRKRIKSKEE